MKTKKNIFKFLMILLVFTLSLQIVYSKIGNVEPIPGLEDVLKYENSGVNQSENLSNEIKDECKNAYVWNVKRYVNCGTNSVLYSIGVSSDSMLSGIVLQANKLLLMHYNFDYFYRFWDFFRLIASVLTILFIVYLGYQWILSDISEDKRLEAKKSTRDLFFFLVLMNVSFWLLKYVILLGNGIALAFWDIFFKFLNLKTSFLMYTLNNLFELMFFIILAPIIVWYTIKYVMRLIMRHLIVVGLFISSPLWIFLFYFKPTRGIGKSIAYTFFINLFFSTIFVLILGSVQLFVASAPPIAGLFRIVILAVALWTASHLYDKYGIPYFDITSGEHAIKGIIQPRLQRGIETGFRNLKRSIYKK